MPVMMQKRFSISMLVMMQKRFSIIKNKKNEAFGKGLKYKRTDLWGSEIFVFLGCIKIPLHHIPDLCTTMPVLSWECMVMVFLCILSSLGKVRDNNST
jgi:hypothetical protein